MQIILAVCYVLIGLVIAMPYLFLAGWDTSHIGLVALLAPVCSFIWFMVASFAGIITTDDQQRILIDWRALFSNMGHPIQGIRKFLWLWTIIITLPIMCHWSAKAFGIVGMTKVASFLEASRYASFGSAIIGVFAAVLGSLLVCLAFDVCRLLWRQLCKVAARICRRRPV